MEETSDNKLYLKLARVDVGNGSKKGENMDGIIDEVFLRVGF